MRIAVLLMNAGRGSGEVARQHAKHLVRQGHEVHFMHPAVGAGVEGATNHDVQLHSSTTPVHEYLPSAGADQEAVSQMSAERAELFLRDYVRALEGVADQVDLIFAHHANLPAIAAAEVAGRHGKPYALFLHGTGIEPRHSGQYDDAVWARIRAALEGADGVLVTTEYVRDELVLPMVDVPLERFLILPCGIDLEAFRSEAGDEIRAEYGLPETYVICPGALTTAKGPQNVVAASVEYAALAPTIFIGDGELRAELERELEGRGRFLGFVSAAHKEALINAATILTAAPDKKEHFGIIYAEALAAGTPPVAYEGGGVGSIVTPETGILTARDPRVLGRAIRELLGDRERLAAMASAGRQRAEESFGAEQLGARLEGWLADLVAARQMS